MSKRWWRPAEATRTGAIRPGGAWESPSIRSLAKSTGRKKARRKADWADSAAPILTFPRARAQRTAPISRCYSISCRSRSISSSISKIASSTGPTAAIDKKAVPEILITHLMEGIGIALDVPGNRMFVTDFAGSLYSADLDGKNERDLLFAQGNLTGIAYT